ncbi:hypothetical protein IAT40_001986 [Kwoniella sp. CBS 6097]
MAQPLTFKRYRAVDKPYDYGYDDELDETQEERVIYDQEVWEEISWKETGLKGCSDQAAQHVAEYISKASETVVIEEQEDPTPSTIPPPSFNISHIVQTSTPRILTSTYPSVPTPEVISNKLPDPAPIPSVSSRPSSPPRRSIIIDTPQHIASPIDTPTTSANEPRRPSFNNTGADSGIEGKGRRDDPATPVPLGKSALSEVKSKKDHQAITKHFDLLSRSKLLVQQPKNVRHNSKQALGRAVTMAAGLGGQVFEGLRFCLTSEVNQTAKLKQRADIIANLGGQAVLQPDTAITHVVYDQGKSASLLAAKLGLETLSELPQGTICVKWDWVVQCKMVGKLLDPAPWLSFPKTSFSRAVSANAIRPTSRIFDITDQLRGKSVAISRKREPTASDSDTEESAKRTRLTQARSITVFPPVLENLPGPSRTQPLDVTVATEHALPSGPGWHQAKTDDRDALDEMIDGVKEGSLSDPEASDGEEDKGVSCENYEENDIGSLIQLSQNPNPKADGYKFGRKNDGKGYVGPNEWLAKKFEELHSLYQGQAGKNSFAIRGYQRAAGIMRRIDYPIVTGAQARAIPGIGSSLADRIDEFLTGAQGRAYYENTEQARCIALFKDIYGVGRTHANDLYRLGARSITDLRSGSYPLTPGQKIGLELYDELNSRIPRDECRLIFEAIRDEAKAIDPDLWIEIMGSYRRGSEDSGDVDILITRQYGSAGLDDGQEKGILGELVDRLRKKGIITHDLSTPSDCNAAEAKWMGVGRLAIGHKHRRIDILCIPDDQWGAALLYFTGNEVVCSISLPHAYGSGPHFQRTRTDYNTISQFNRSMRLYARKQGYSLNQRGLYKGVIRARNGQKQTEGELVASRTEQEIFDVLGLRWRHPHHRRP